eukprot:274796_1
MSHNINMFDVRSNTPYEALETSSIQFVRGSYTRVVWYMRLIGGFAESKWCLFPVILYHLINIAFAVWTFLPSSVVNKENKLFCREFQITIFAIQIQSFILYIIGYYSLNYKDIDNILDRALEGRFKSPKWMYIFIIIPFSVCIVSALVSWSESKHYYNHIRYYLQFILYIFDMFKWNQIIMIVSIIFGFLNTFPEEIHKFENKIKKYAKQYKGKFDHKLKIIAKKKQNISIITTDSNDTALSPPCDMIQFGEDIDSEFDTNKFKLKYNQFTKGYDQIMKQFHLFIVVFCLCIMIMWGLLLFTIVISFSKKNSHCSSTNTLMSFFIHYASEIFLYFVIWSVIIGKLNRNHSVLKKYR